MTAWPWYPVDAIVIAAILVALVAWLLREAFRWLRARFRKPRHAAPAVPRLVRTDTPSEAEAAEAKARREAEYATLAGIPGEGEDMYTDPTVRLPFSERPPGPTLWQTLRAHVEDPSVALSDDEWEDRFGHYRPAAERLADTDVRKSAAPAPPATTEPAPDGQCRCGQPAGHFREALEHASLGDIAGAFDTATFDAVKG